MKQEIERYISARGKKVLNTSYDNFNSVVNNNNNNNNNNNAILGNAHIFQKVPM
jgi:hypothetical protein